MHREIRHTHSAFAPENNLSLFLMTGLLGLLIAVDLIPRLLLWLGVTTQPVWSAVYFGQPVVLIAAVLGGARILYTALEALFEGRLGADLALAIACVAAILVNEPLVAAEVVFIGMVGECLESLTFARTQRAIRKIVEVCPRRCWLLRDGQEVRVFTSELKVGDRVVVKPGARVPADGEVVEGRSAVDTSALTGESLPLDKGAGDKVLAGSLNQFGALTIECQQVAEHTVVGRVIELTARALQDKASIERTADRLARYFLPVVLGLAALTFLAGMLYHGTAVLRGADAMRYSFAQAARLSIYPTLAVLVVACPCALILATPAAIIAALGRLAGTGVLIKGGSALERLAQVSAVAFDKTGTLTQGRLELGDILPLEGITPDELLRVAGAAEQRSEHLLAQLIVQEARRRQLALDPVEDFQARPGAGVTARSGDVTVIVGTRRLLEEQGVALNEPALALLQRLDASGQTALLVARSGTLLGAIGARDRVRPEAAQVLAELRLLGIKDIALFTGDRAASAKPLAEELRIEHVFAELLPEEKAALLAEGKWRHDHANDAKTAAFVGDGINDAPALASAGVGLALGGTGTDVAAEAGDIVLMGAPLAPLPLLVRLSRQTVHIIRQNIFVFAFAVNIVGVVLTAWLWPLLAPAEWYEQSPLAAVLYHQLGSLAVLLNSMRLLWFERTASPALAGWKQSFQKMDRWIEQYLDVGELLHRLSHRWRPVLAGLLLVLFAGYALSGFTVLGPDEQGVRRRFGRPVEDLGPGLTWCWPWPVEDVVRIKPERIRVVEIGFRSTAGLGQKSLSWASAHKGDGILRVPDEAVMITGDGNLVEIQASVRYRVTDVRTFLFEVGPAEDILRGLAEAELRGLIASRPFLQLLTTSADGAVSRERFQAEVLDRLRQRCLDYHLGIELDGLALHDLHPPQEVVAAYYEVTRAMEERDRMVNFANAESHRKEQAALADKRQLVLQAEAAGNEKVKQARAELMSFTAKSDARGQLDMDQEWQLFRQALNGDGLATGEYARLHKELTAKQATLTDFRLFWEAVAQALTGRELMLIDADRLPGRRHLLLFDPNQFRVPVPIVMPPDRNPPPRGP
jgi:Cu+-exporting ATPase